MCASTANPKLSADDRFFSLVEYFTRAQDAVLRQRAGLPLQCRVYTADGRDLTGTLHSRGSSSWTTTSAAAACAAGCWSSFRRRFIVRVLPGALLWAVVFTVLVGVLGLRPDVVLAIALGALAVQAVLLWSTARRR